MLTAVFLQVYSSLELQFMQSVNLQHFLLIIKYSVCKLFNYSKALGGTLHIHHPQPFHCLLYIIFSKKFQGCFMEFCSLTNKLVLETPPDLNYVDINVKYTVLTVQNINCNRQLIHELLNKNSVKKGKTVLITSSQGPR